MNLLKNVVTLVKETAEEAMHTTPLEKALYNTTSNLSTITAVSDQELVADHTNYYEDSKTIVKYINKKLKRDNNKRIILRVGCCMMQTLDLVDYLIKNGAMRIVHEIRDEKYQIKSLRNLLGADDEAEVIEMITRKSNSILELLGDEKRLEEERNISQATKNRYKGSGNTSGGYGGYGGESYEGMGSEANRGRRRDEDSGSRYGGYGSDKPKEREREREREFKPSTSGGKYDPSVGQSNLMKKLGIQDQKKQQPADDDIEFPEDEVVKEEASKPVGKVATEVPQPKAGSKFLPPPPSKNGGLAAPPSKTTAPSASGDLLGGDLLGVEVKPQVATPAPNKPAMGGADDLLGMDLFGGGSAQPAKPVAQTQLNQGGFGNLGSQNVLGTQSNNGFGNLGGQQQQQGGMGNLTNMGAGLGYQQQHNGGANNQQQMFGMNGGTGFQQQGLGMMGNQGSFGQQPQHQQANFGQHQQANFGQQGGFSHQSNMGGGFNAGFNQQPQSQTGFGSAGMGNLGGFSQPQQQQQQQGGPKKLITFDNKQNDDFDAFQEAKPRNAGLNSYSNAEADLIDLSDLTSETVKKKKEASNVSGGINMSHW